MLEKEYIKSLKELSERLQLLTLKLENAYGDSNIEHLKDVTQLLRKNESLRCFTCGDTRCPNRQKVEIDSNGQIIED